MRVAVKIKYIAKFQDRFYTVFDTKVDKNGFPKFLIYKNNAWIWCSAKYFRPWEE